MDDQLGSDCESTCNSGEASLESQDSTGTVSYKLPSIELMDKLTAADALQITADDLLATQETIVNRLANLGVKVFPGDITCGCNVTRYEIYPDVGGKRGKDPSTPERYCNGSPV